MLRILFLHTQAAAAWGRVLIQLSCAVRCHATASGAILMHLPFIILASWTPCSQPLAPLFTAPGPQPPSSCPRHPLLDHIAHCRSWPEPPSFMTTLHLPHLQPCCRRPSFSPPLSSLLRCPHPHPPLDNDPHPLLPVCQLSSLHITARMAVHVSSQVVTMLTHAAGWQQGMLVHSHSHGQHAYS